MGKINASDKIML